MSDTTTLAEELVDRIDTGRPVEHDGIRWYIRSFPDYDNPFDEWDCYGRIAEVVNDRWGDGRQRPRPDGFDGRARIISTRDGRWWWQPPADITDPAMIDMMRRHAADLLEYGTQCLVVERHEQCACHHQWHDVASAALGGIEPFAERAHLIEIVADLCADTTPPENT